MGNNRRSAAVLIVGFEYFLPRMKFASSTMDK